MHSACCKKMWSKRRTPCRGILHAWMDQRCLAKTAMPPAGQGAGEGNSQAIIAPVLAVGTGTGAIYLVSVSTLQVQQHPSHPTRSPAPFPAVGHLKLT